MRSIPEWPQKIQPKGTKTITNGGTMEIKPITLVLCLINYSTVSSAEPRRPEITEAQKSCLESKIGKPDQEGPRPTREEMESAFNACGITPPDHDHRPPPPREGMMAPSGPHQDRSLNNYNDSSK
ncbi:MAG: hypothetical protein K1X29_09060 [Bdellovibrionales bacterium]|nr:hypothetical protein [Bdellovibrionales bacterium]